MNEPHKEAAQAFYSVYLPTRLERLWRSLGFRYHLGEEPEGYDGMQFVRTDMGLHFSLKDRLRVLFSGKLFIRSTVYSAEPPPKEPKSRMDWHILPPGETWP